MTHPLADAYDPDPADEALVARALAGERDPLEVLVRRHQRWLYNIALRMLSSPADAEDVTQEALIKIVTRLATFRGDSAFRTWAYRIALRTILDRKRGRAEAAVGGFDCYARFLRDAPDAELPDLAAASAHVQLVVEETKLGCMLGMLLCLDREQRLVFVLGALFEVSDTVGAAVLELGRDNFRQRLSRARAQLAEFMAGRCGLVDPGNPCRCARKTRAFIRDGLVDPDRLVFAQPHVARMREASARGRPGFERAIESASAALWGTHPFLEGPDLVARLRAIVPAVTP